MELFHANRQWSTRPDDQRFPSLEAMHAACKAYAGQARESNVRWGALTVGSDDGNVIVQGPAKVPATMTHYAFGQLAARAGAPANFLRSLPAPLAADVLNDRLAARQGNGDDQAQLLIHQNGGLVVRAVTSENYVRVWNYEIIQRAIDLCARMDLQPARPTFRQFGTDAPALYASDHDMFAFLMTRTRVYKDPTGAELFRGIILQNSEVGDCALKILAFWFREICGNHIIWGAKELTEVRLTHVGQIRQRWMEASATVRRYFDTPNPDGSRFAQVTARIAGSKDDVLDTVFGKRIPDLTRKVLASGYDAVVPDQDGDPATPWGLAQGLTRYSQTLPFADERQAIDRAAGKLLQVAF